MDHRESADKYLKDTAARVTRETLARRDRTWTRSFSVVYALMWLALIWWLVFGPHP